MNKWRAFLGLVFMVIAVLGAFLAGLYFKVPVLQVVAVFFCFDLGMLGMCFAQDDGLKRRKASPDPAEEKKV